VTPLRFLLDDATPCRTQQAVLSVFATDLEERARGTVIRTSQLTGMQQWADVPAESSRRLGLRLLALQPAPDQLTVFLPGHIVPGTIDTGSRWGSALAAREFSTVADLDVFAVDSTGSEVCQFHEFVAAHPDYESVSRYAGFTSAALPGWLVSGGLTSALKLTQRPWYCAYAPTRLQWLSWVRRAVDQGLLDLSRVEEDVRTGLVRPSLLAEVKAVMQGTDALPLPDLTLDTLFMAPERRLTDQQYRLLHSAELAERTLKFAKRKSARKGSKRGLLNDIQRVFKRFLKLLWFLLRRLPQRIIQAAYRLYSITARPAVQRWRGQSRPGE
jgi:hypothetical protein